MSSPPRPSWLYLLIDALSLPVVKVLFRYRAAGARKVTEWLRDAVTVLERSLT